MPFVGEILGQMARRGARTAEAMKQDDDAAAHRLECLLALDVVELRPAIGEAAPGAANVILVKQSIIAGEHIPLNPPIAEEQFVRPELLTAERGSSEIWLAGGSAAAAGGGRENEQEQSTSPRPGAMATALNGHAVTSSDAHAGCPLGPWAWRPVDRHRFEKP